MKLTIHDLRQYLLELRHQDHGILLVGDFNEPLHPNYTGMTKLCSDFGLIDLMYHLLSRDDFPTWARGTSRPVDYVLCDQWIADTALTGCYEPFGYRTKGDRCNIAIDFDALQLFSNPTFNLATPSSRNSPRKIVSQFFNTLAQSTNISTDTTLSKGSNASKWNLIQYSLNKSTATCFKPPLQQ